MSRTTFQIGASLQATFPKHVITHLRNYEVNDDGDSAEGKIVGVLIRYQVVESEVRWCYI